MARKVYIVQFTHPGGEHSLTQNEIENGIKQWNYGPHRRKFMKANGQFIMEDGSLSDKQELLFWGEWEPTSKLTPVGSTVATCVMPQYVHEPFLKGTSGALILPPYYNNSGKGRQNTDPFIFGEYFLYSVCKQRMNMRNSSLTKFTKLGELAKGSIILFGSTVSEKQGGPYFALDTVFVVEDYKDYQTHHARTDLNGYVASEYIDIMGFDEWKDNIPFVCYKGATVENAINGIFSFVPCKPCSSGVVGFPRVRITQSDLCVITNNLNAAPKYSDCCLPYVCWGVVRDIVKSQGFELGVNFEYKYLL